MIPSYTRLPVNVTVYFRIFRINYIYLFDMDPREVTIPLNVLNNVALEIIVVLANLLIYFKVIVYQEYSQYLPKRLGFSRD